MEFSDDIVSMAQMVFGAVMTSTTFALLVGFLGLYCLVLLLDIILLFVLRPVGGDLKKGFFGSKERPLAFASTLRREWARIEKRLAAGSPSDDKLAILEADAFVDRMLSEMGYPGKDVGERLLGIPPGHFSSLSGIIEAHDVRNGIIRDRKYALDHSEAKRVVKLYFAFLDEAEILE